MPENQLNPTTNEEFWDVTFRIFRMKENEPSHFQDFTLQIDPDLNILDAVEMIWAHHDRTLMYRHACHHSTCGACGMRVNGVEKLTCITSIRQSCKNGGRITIEPLRNFPIVSDLVIDMGSLYRNMDLFNASQVLDLDEAALQGDESLSGFERLVDCIECGLCISACPSAATDIDYLGPATLSAAQQESHNGIEAEFLINIDHENGLWRCHNAYECTEVCPSNVDPGWRIMDLRKQMIKQKFRNLFRKENS